MEKVFFKGCFMRNLVQESLARKSIIWDNGEEILALALSSQYDTSPRKSPTTVYPYDVFKDRKNLIDEILVCLSNDANKRKLSKSTVFGYRYAICSILKITPKITTFVDMSVDLQNQIRSQILENQYSYTYLKGIFVILRRCFLFYNPQKKCFFDRTKRLIINKSKKYTLTPSNAYAELVVDKLRVEIDNIKTIFREYQKELLIYQCSPKKYFFSLENFAKAYIDGDDEAKNNVKKLFALIHKRRLKQEEIDNFPTLARKGVNIFNLREMSNIVYFVEDVILNENMGDFCFSFTPMSEYTKLKTKYPLDLFLKKFFHSDRQQIRKITEIRFVSSNCVIPFILFLMAKKGMNSSTACNLQYNIGDKFLLDYKNGDTVYIHAFKRRAQKTEIYEIDPQGEAELYQNLLLSQEIISQVRGSYVKNNLFFTAFLRQRGEYRFDHKDIERFLRLFIKQNKICDNNGELIKFLPKHFRSILAENTLLGDRDIIRVKDILNHSSIDTQSRHYYNGERIQAFFKSQLRSFVEDEYNRAVQAQTRFFPSFATNNSIIKPIETKNKEHCYQCLACRHALIMQENLPTLFFLKEHSIIMDDDTKSIIDEIIKDFNLGGENYLTIRQNIKQKEKLYSLVLQSLEMHAIKKGGIENAI